MSNSLAISPASTAANERLGDRLGFTYDDVAGAALSGIEASYHEMFKSALGVMVVLMTGVGGGPKGVKAAVGSLRTDYVAKQVAAGFAETAAVKAWQRHHERVQTALIKLDEHYLSQSEETKALKPSALRAIVGAYHVNASDVITKERAFAFFRDELAAIGIKDGPSFAMATRPAAKTAKEKTLDDIVKSILNTLKTAGSDDLMYVANALKREAKARKAMSEARDAANALEAVARAAEAAAPKTAAA